MSLWKVNAREATWPSLLSNLCIPHSGVTKGWNCGEMIAVMAFGRFVLDGPLPGSGSTAAITLLGCVQVNTMEIAETDSGCRAQ